MIAPTHELLNNHNADQLRRLHVRIGHILANGNRIRGRKARRRDERFQGLEAEVRLAKGARVMQRKGIIVEKVCPMAPSEPCKSLSTTRSSRRRSCQVQLNPMSTTFSSSFKGTPALPAYLPCPASSPSSPRKLIAAGVTAGGIHFESRSHSTYLWPSQHTERRA